MTTKKKAMTPPAGTLAILSEVTPIASGKLMHEATANLSLVEQVQVHCILKKVKTAVEGRLAEIHEPLMSLAESTGAPNENGHKELDVDGSRVVVEHRKAKLPSDDGVRKLLKDANIPLTEAFDEVKSMVLNASKLDFLVQTGKLTKEALDALRSDTPALQVYPSKFLKDAVKSVGFSPTKKELSE